MPTGTLPESGKRLWESVYKKAKKSGDSESSAAQQAWGAVRQAGWKKVEGKWVKKSLVDTFSMHISRASLDGKIMRWQAVNSDTDPDSYDERMSLELYADFINYIKKGIPVPAEFNSVCSPFWQGGMPYVSLSHYLDLNGKAVPGDVSALYVDGNKLKAKGILSDSPLGHAVCRSLLADKYKQPEEKIRISIGFLDLGHKHGDSGALWVREKSTSICPECLEGIGQKIYIKGYLVHLALTRVPVNKRTEMVLEN